MEGQRVRGKNFSASEKNILFELVTGKYKPYLENKQTDAVTVAKKNLAWQQLAKEFNSQSRTGQRTAKQLHVLYDNLKKNARSNLLSDKQNAYKIGDGRFTPKSSELDAKIVTVLQDQLPNRYYSKTTLIDVQPSCSDSAPATFENYYLKEEDMLIECTDSTISEPNTEYLHEATTSEQGSAENTFPTSTPVPEDNLRARRQRKPPLGKGSVQVSKKRKQCIETLSSRFVQRKNFKDQHDKEIHAKKLEILEIEKEIKLKQLAIVQQQLELEKLNFTNRLEKVEWERKIRD